MISIEAKPLELAAELEGYGIFYVRKMGAGTEAEIRYRLDEANNAIEEMSEKYKGIIDKEKELMEAKDDKALEELRNTPRYKELLAKQKETGERLESVYHYTRDVQLKLWRSDDPEAVKKLFEDFSFDQIQSLYKQVMESENA